MKEKMRNEVMILSILLLSLVPVFSRNNYILKEDLKVKSPRVMKYDCTNCFWDDSVNHLCVDNSVDVTGGWEFI